MTIMRLSRLNTGQILVSGNCFKKWQMRQQTLQIRHAHEGGKQLTSSRINIDKMF